MPMPKFLTYCNDWISKKWEHNIYYLLDNTQTDNMKKIHILLRYFLFILKNKKDIEMCNLNTGEKDFNATSTVSFNNKIPS